MKNNEIYNSRKKNRAERLKFLELLDHIIFNTTMSDEKYNKLKELRANSYRYSKKELEEKTAFILYNN